MSKKFQDLDHLEIKSDRDPGAYEQFKDTKPVIWINKKTGRRFRQVITWIEVGGEHEPR